MNMLERSIPVRIPTPHVYINVHQTIWVALAVGIVAAYVTDFHGFRDAVNQLAIDISRS